MGKLIELLNEMIKSKGNCYKIIDYAWWVFIIDDKANKYRCNLYPAVVISKEYWFIKWLVENNKIKLWAYDIEWYHFNAHTYLDLIMLLSIQDNPIEFLISILK